MTFSNPHLHVLILYSRQFKHSVMLLPPLFLFCDYMAPSVIVVLCAQLHLFCFVLKRCRG